MYRLMDGIEFMKSLPDKSVDGIFTDPPWGSDHRHRKTAQIPGHEIWRELISLLNENAPAKLKEGHRVLIWCGARIVGEIVRLMNNFEMRWFVVCQYIGASRYTSCFIGEIDPILYFALPGSAWPKRGSNFRLPFLRQLYRNIQGGGKTSNHPCPRPAKVVKQILNDWFDPNEYVIDPFAGSDTTGRAARELNLKWDSCEIDSKMYKTGLARHSQQLLFEQKRGI